MIKKIINKEKIKNILNQEHSGSEAVESMILTPLVYITFIILLYVFFMILTFVNYSNIANKVAMELNMRQSGYQSAMNNYPTLPAIKTYQAKVNSDGSTPAGTYLSSSKVEISPYTNELRCGTNFALTKYKDDFAVPFNELKGITVTSSKALSTSLKSSMAGTVIRVDVSYSPMVFGTHTFFTIKATGYNVIS